LRAKGSRYLDRAERRKASSKFIHQRERTLLLHSETPKTFEWLVNWLRNNEDITNELIDGLPADRRSFFKSVYPNVREGAIKEWVGKPSAVEDKGPDRRAWARCSLCNQPNRYICYIVNQVSHEPLNVGSDCVKHFGGFEGLGNIRKLVGNASRLRSRH
jgi:hypothetical protein